MFQAPPYFVFSCNAVDSFTAFIHAEPHGDMRSVRFRSLSLRPLEHLQERREHDPRSLRSKIGSHLRSAVWIDIQRPLILPFLFEQSTALLRQVPPAGCTCFVLRLTHDRFGAAPSGGGLLCQLPSRNCSACPTE